MEARRLAELKKQAHGGSAYKAAGLEKIFGKEKTDASPSSGNAGDGELSQFVVGRSIPSS